MASFIELFRLPISRQGCKSKTCIISAPSTGGWKFRIRSFSSRSFNFCLTSLKLSRKRCLRTSFLDVMSASHRVIKSSMSSPASNRRRRTAESVTISSAITIGRMCNSTSFSTYFIFSFIGSFILRNISGIIFPPM